MKIVDFYFFDVKKRTLKLLKKIFGITTIREGLREKECCKKSLECKMNKSLDKFTIDDVKNNGYLYSKYRTLDKILELYVEVVELKYFTIKELEEYNENRRSRKN